MAPRPANGDPVRGIALLRDLDRVEPHAADRRGDAAAFVERRLPPAASRDVRRRPISRRPMPPASSSAVQVNSTSRRRPGIGSLAGSRPAARAASAEEPDDAELHRDHALHVDGAAAVDVAVDEIGRERVVGPAVRRRRDDVEMRQEQERLATGPIATQPGMDRSASRERLRLISGSRPASRRMSPMCRAATSSWSGASGGGGLIDGIRIRSRSVATSRSVASSQAAWSSSRDGAPRFVVTTRPPASQAIDDAERRSPPSTTATTISTSRRP